MPTIADTIVITGNATAKADATDIPLVASCRTSKSLRGWWSSVVASVISSITDLVRGFQKTN